MDPVILGERIKAVRNQADFTEKQIADYIEVHQTQISRFEKGERGLNFELIEKICVLCGYSLPEIIRGDFNKAPLTFAFRSKGLEPEDIKAIAEINQIALDLIRMQKLSMEMVKHD